MLGVQRLSILSVIGNLGEFGEHVLAWYPDMVKSSVTVIQGSGTLTISEPVPSRVSHYHNALPPPAFGPMSPAVIPGSRV
jgi:hypothetical protein